MVIGGYGINQDGGVVVMVVMMIMVVMMKTVEMVVMVIGGYGTNHGGGVVAPAKMMDQQKPLAPPKLPMPAPPNSMGLCINR